MSDLTTPDGVQPDPRDLRGAPEGMQARVMPDDDVHAHSMNDGDGFLRNSDPTGDLSIEPEGMHAMADGDDVAGHGVQDVRTPGSHAGSGEVRNAADGLLARADEFGGQRVDEDDVEGHVMNESEGYKLGEARVEPDEFAARLVQGEGAQQRVEGDDVEGHRYIPNADDDVEGHRVVAAADDDGYSHRAEEGEGFMAMADGDDVEGHRLASYGEGFRSIGDDGPDPDGIQARVQPDGPR